MCEECSCIFCREAFQSDEGKMCKSHHLLWYLSTDSGICTQVILCFFPTFISHHGLLLPFKSAGTRKPKACVCRTESTDSFVARVQSHWMSVGWQTVLSQRTAPQLMTAACSCTRCILIGLSVPAKSQSSTTFLFLQALNIVCHPGNQPVVSHQVHQSLKQRFQGRSVTGCYIERLLSAFACGPNLDCVQGAGTTESILTRVLVSRSEIDLSDIKAEYKKLFGFSLHSHLEVITGWCALVGTSVYAAVN